MAKDESPRDWWRALSPTERLERAHHIVLEVYSAIAPSGAWMLDWEHLTAAQRLLIARYQEQLAKD